MNKINKLMNMQGRRVLVTGAAGFLGREIVSALSELGAHIYVTDISRKVLSVFDDKKKSKISIIPCDLSSEEERKFLIKEIKKLDVLINNAAYVGSSNLKGWKTKFQNQSLDTWREAIEVNLTAPFHLIRDFSPVLKQSDSASIINISSIYGHSAPDYSLYRNTKMNNPAAYSISKAGINQLTKWSASTLAPKVRVNTISIGGIYRKQDKNFVRKYVNKTLLKRMAKEKDVIGAIIFLSTDLSKYVTGQNLFVDGGFTTL